MQRYGIHPHYSPASHAQVEAARFAHAKHAILNNFRFKLIDTATATRHLRTLGLFETEIAEELA